MIRRAIHVLIAIAIALFCIWFVGSRLSLFGIRHDSQEDDATRGPIIRQVLHETSQAVAVEYDAKHWSHLGMCHRVWHFAKKRLHEEYQIDWSSPREMNPFVNFD